MKEYLDLLNHIYNNGQSKDDRTNTGTRSLFGYQMRINIENSFPLLTTKKLPFRWIVEELLWFLSGDTNEKTLNDKGITIWKEWADLNHTSKFNREPGDLGPIYGYLWRSFGGDYPTLNGVDQITNVIEQIKSNPSSRRLIVSGWNPKTANEVTLPPCHTLFQFFVNDNKLSCQLYQRSGDVFLGVPFNIASYALLTYMIAHVCNLKPYEFIHTFGDVHIYNNHIEQVKLQLNRIPTKLPTLELNPNIKNIFDFTYDDIKLVDYKAQSTIKAPVAI